MQKILITTALSAFVLLLCHVGTAHAELRIAEVLSSPASDWNGDGEIDFKNDEWVEIVNDGPQVESLDGVYLRDGLGDTYHYGFSGSLAPGAVLVVYGSDSVAWQAANDAGSSGLSLNNSGDRVELWRDLAEPRVLEALDTLDVPAHAAGTERSLALDPVSGGWVIHDALGPYTGEIAPLGTGCSPSPGLLNACDSVVPTDATRWGRLKSEY